MSGRKSRDIGVERAIVGGAMALAFLGAFLDDPPPTAGMMLLLFVDKLVILIVVIAAAQFLSKRGPPKRWLGPFAIMAVAAAWVAGGQLRDPVQKAGLFPMTNAAVVAQVRDLSPTITAQYQAWLPAIRANQPLPPPALTGRTDEAGRYVDAQLKLFHAIASLSADFSRQCGATALRPTLEGSRIVTPAGRKAAHEALSTCQDAALRNRAETLRLGNTMPDLAAGFRQASLRDPLREILDTVWTAMRPDMLKVWDLMARQDALVEEQITMLDATGRWRLQGGRISFLAQADNDRFDALGRQAGALDQARAEAARSALATGQRAMAAEGIEAPGGPPLPVMAP